MAHTESLVDRSHDFFPRLPHIVLSRSFFSNRTEPLFPDDLLSIFANSMAVFRGKQRYARFGIIADPVFGLFTDPKREDDTMSHDWVIVFRGENKEVSCAVRQVPVSSQRPPGGFLKDMK